MREENRLHVNGREGRPQDSTTGCRLRCGFTDSERMAEVYANGIYVKTISSQSK